MNKEGINLWIDKLVKKRNELAKEEEYLEHHMGEYFKEREGLRRGDILVNSSTRYSFIRMGFSVEEALRCRDVDRIKVCAMAGEVRGDGKPSLLESSLPEWEKE